MRGWRETLDSLAVLSRDRLALRGLLIVLQLLPCLFILGGNGGLGVGHWVFAALFATVAALSPDSPAPAVSMGYGLWLWLAQAPDAGVVNGWTVAASLCWLLVHVGSALSAVGPEQTPLPGALWRAWGVRTTILAGITLMLGALAWWVTSRDHSPNLVLTFFAVGVFLLLVGGVTRHVLAHVPHESEL